MSTGIQAQTSNFAIAENYYRDGAYTKAAELFKDLVDKSPYNTTYLKRLVSCYQETDRLETSKKLLEQQIKSKPNLKFLNVLLGYNYERAQNFKKAQKLYKKAIGSISETPGYGRLIAQFFKDYNKLDFAIKAYQETALFNPTANYHFEIAKIYGEKGDFELMFNAYFNYLDNNDSYLNIVKRNCAKYISENKDDANNIRFKKILLLKSADNPKDVWNDLLRWLFIKQKDYGKALIQNKALYARDNDRLASIYQLGEIAYQNKDYDTAKKCFNFIIEKTNYPTDKFNAIGMNLQIAIQKNDPTVNEKFQTFFEEYGINNTTFTIQLAYADYLTFSQNKPEEAKSILEKALPFSNDKFESAQAKLKLADIYVYQSLFHKALIYYSQVQLQFKNHEIGQLARFKVAQTSYFKNDFKWAKVQLKVLKSSASQLIANDAAALFLVISDNEPRDSIPNGLKKYAAADLLAFQHKYQESLLLLEDLISTFKGQPIEDEALFKQAKLFVTTNEIPSAIENYKAIIAIDENGILADDAYYYLAELYAKHLKNVDQARAYYQKIIFDYPSSIYLVPARKQFRKLRGDQMYENIN